MSFIQPPIKHTFAVRKGTQFIVRGMPNKVSLLFGSSGIQELSGHLGFMPPVSG